MAADAPLSTVQVHQSLIPLQRERHYPQQIHPLPHSPWMCLYLPRLSFPRRTTQSKQSLSFQMTIDGDPPTDAAHRPVLGAAFWSDGPAMLYVLRSQAGRPSLSPTRTKGHMRLGDIPIGCIQTVARSQTQELGLQHRLCTSSRDDWVQTQTPFELPAREGV